jgi:hypothetical protein
VTSLDHLHRLSMNSVIRWSTETTNKNRTCHPSDPVSANTFLYRKVVSTDS